jgi:biopolymer transport protein ExbD
MAFGSLQDDGDDAPLAEINMVPLIDVMLVLLIIFIVAAPLLTHAVKVDLPKASSSPNTPPPESVQVSIDANNQIFWNKQAVDAPTLANKLAEAAQQMPQPTLHLRADRTTPYEKIAQVMSSAAKAGLVKIGFVTDPSTTP